MVSDEAISLLGKALLQPVATINVHLFLLSLLNAAGTGFRIRISETGCNRQFVSIILNA
ncbi:MAG: hypothetical protein LUQ50_13195 [Methanospirillum sp.]|nr:hypothetical protein [Methanospirillum sp.]